MSTSVARRASTRGILRRIRWVRLRLLLVGLVRALALVLLLSGAVALGTYLVDREWEPSHLVRVSIALFAGGVILSVAGALLWSWLRRDLSDDRVALMIESANPWLESSLISAVQLSRELDESTPIHSQDLIRSLIEQTDGEARGLRLARPARIAPVLPISLLSLAVIGALSASFFWSETKTYAVTWRDRMLLLSKKAQYPKPVDIEVKIDGLEPGSTTVQLVRGEDLEVEVRIVRGGTEGIDIITNFSISRRQERKPMARLEDSAFSKTYQNVTEPFRFYVDAGDSVISDVYTVKLVDRARVEEASFWLSYPEYTHKPATPDDAPISWTSFEVPVGTEVRYEVVATRPVKEARLLRMFEGKDKRQTKGPNPAVSGEEEWTRRILTGAFVVKESQRFRFELVSEDGVVGDKNQVTYTIQAIEDRPPVLTFLTPGRSKAVTKKAEVPMHLQVKDEYGIDRTELRVKIKRDGKELRSLQTPLTELDDPEAKPGSKETKPEYKWKFSVGDLELQEGDQVEYYAAAFDRNLDESRRMGVSLAYTFTIVSSANMKSLLQDRVLRLKENLSSAKKSQEIARKDMEAAQDKVSVADKLSREDQRRLSRVESAQRNVSTRMKQIAGEFRKIQEEREANQLLSEQDSVLQRKLQEGSRDVAEVRSPAVERDLKDLQANPEKLDRSKLARIPDKQAAIEKQIDELVQQLDEWGSITDVMRALRDIRDGQRRVRDGTQEKLKPSEGSSGSGGSDE